MPYIAQVAVGRREKLNIWGDDYPTPDGTGVRDYIHVTDLANGHLKALESLKQAQCVEVNLGTGKGQSVLDLVHAFQRVSGKTVPYVIAARRDGDVASCYANSSLAEQYLNWKAEFTLEQMCNDHWQWQKNNTNGYN